MNSTAAPAPELGAFRPFGWARSPLATTFLVLTVVLVYWRRSYRPLNRRPLLMRSLATLWFVLQATGRSFVAACWITTCLSWLAELAMVMTVLSHTWQCFAYFRISQLHEQMRKNIKPTDEGFVLPVLLRVSLYKPDRWPYNFVFWVFLFCFVLFFCGFYSNNRSILLQNFAFLLGFAGTGRQ